MRETGGEREGGRKFEVQEQSKEVLHYARYQYNMNGQKSTELLVHSFCKTFAFSPVLLYGAIFNLAAPSSSSSSAAASSASASVRRGGWREGKMR